MYDHKFGKKSIANLKGVHPSLIAVAELAIRLCEYDGTVISGGGLRTLAQCQANVKNKTGILNSLHRKQSDGYGHAIDLISLTPGKGIDWSNTKAFKVMYESIKDAAAIKAVPIRCGADFNQNDIPYERREFDLCHFEMPKEIYFDKAVVLMNKRRKELNLPV